MDIMKKIETFNQYKKEKQNKKTFVILFQISIFVLFILSWELLVNLNVLNEFLISKPSAILKLFIEYNKENMIWNHVGNF